MNGFLPFLIASLVAAFTWTVLVIVVKRQDREIAGLAGAWVGTLVLAALWQADEVSWLWDFVQGVVLIWPGSIGLLIASLVSILRSNEPGRVTLLCCAVSGIAIHVAAGLAFLWEATVGAGGV